MKPNSDESMNCNDIIEFNVGGCQYTTSKTTIMSYPDSMLSLMVAGLMPSATDKKKRIFIDRDGPLFRHVLNFLRDKQLNLPDGFTEYAQLRQEADFYRIEPIINQLDTLFSNKLGSKSSISSSMSSLVVSSNVNNICDSTTLTQNPTKSLYFTVVSKLYQGTLDSIIGCVRLLSLVSSLDANSKRFLNYLINQNRLNNPKENQPTLIVDSFICECKFMHEEKIICCKPCGLGTGADANLINLCQSIVRLAKRYGIQTGYWEDMFYLTVESSMPNREQLSSLFTDKYNAKLLSTTMCDKRSSYDENLTVTLIERWHIPECKFSN
jgi:hypothetical protein